MAVSENIELEPLVSIIIPCYNQGKFISDALNSIIKQTYSSWECVIVNDGSTDNTEEISLQWVKKDGRIKYFSKPNGGLSSARNFGVCKINGEYIQFLDADDTIAPTKFEKSIKALPAEQADHSIIISDFNLFDDVSGKIIPAYCDLDKVEFSFNSILTGWDNLFTIPIHCGFFSADFFKDIKFNEELRAKEDWVMWLSIFKRFNPAVIYINEKLAIYRINPESLTKNKATMYENTFNAFDIISDKIVNKDELKILFKKINSYWKKEALALSIEVALMNNAKYFRFKKKILNFFSGIGIRLKKSE